MEKQLTEQAGVWIDHRKAVIVTLEPGGERITVIVSHVEKHLERGGDSPLRGAYEAAQVPADDKRQRALTGELNGYYDAVIAALRDTGSVILFGPGEAKGELQKRMLKMKPKVQILAVETEDKMTDPQIAAKVHGYFDALAPHDRHAE
ncbi:MAG: hypothetical protein ABSG18_16605 [Steroidobacteraceae bacterium]|jgi:stalled ribosome rescue protein Dom34